MDIYHSDFSLMIVRTHTQIKQTHLYTLSRHSPLQNAYCANITFFNCNRKV